MTDKQFQEYKELLKTLNIDNVDLHHFAVQDHESAQDLYDSIENDRGFEVEITYYSRAIEYLQYHDNSLLDSISLADQMGYETKNLNSELLASILATEKAKEDWNTIESEIQDFFDSLEEEEEEEE